MGFAVDPVHKGAAPVGRARQVSRSRRRIARLPLLATALLAAHTAPLAAAEQSLTLAGLDVVVWSQPTGGRQPVLVFSHGFHGCATQSRFLLEALAAAGYLVIAPNHRDATCSGGSARWIERPTNPFGEPGGWSDTTYRDRAEDVRAIVAAVATDEQLAPRADLSRLGLVGHSLGGYTVLGLAGAWPSWRLDGVKAVLALSPYTTPFVTRHTLGGLEAPVMFQGGTWDFGVTPMVRKPDGAYEQAAAPKYFVEFLRAGHFAWTDLRAVDRTAIVAYAVAFLDRYVKGEPADPLLTHPGDRVAELRSSER